MSAKRLIPLSIALALSVASVGRAASSWHDPVFAATTSGSITHSGLPTVDGVGVPEDRAVLDKDNATASLRGVWVVKSGAWVRRIDTTGVSVINGAVYCVQNGSVNGGHCFELNGFDYLDITGGTVGPAFVGDSGSGGVKGLVPAPAAGDAAAGKYLDADGTWTVPPAPSAPSFDDLTSGTNTAAAMVVGTGASLAASGSGTIAATSCTGNSATVTVADAGGDSTTWPLLGTSQTGSLAPASDSGLTYNASTNALTATTFVGALTGNADTCTTAADANLLLGNTWASPEPIGTGTPQSGAFTTLSAAQGTITDPATALGITSTWNDAADTFTALDLDVTDTNSAAASLLMNLRVGGTSKHSFAKNGDLTAAGIGSFSSCVTSSSVNVGTNVVWQNNAYISSPATNEIRMNGWTSDMSGVYAARVVEANTAGSGSPNVLTVIESRKALTNTGATAENYHTLPAATVGASYRFYCDDTDGIRATRAGSDVIRDVGTTGTYINSTTKGSWIELECYVAGEWVITGTRGTWTLN